MALTTEQKAAIKADILADPVLNAFPNNSDGAFEITNIYNQKAVPDYFVWKTNTSTVDIRSVLVWTEYDGLSVSKQNAFAFLCSNHIVDYSLTNVRQGINSIFATGTQTGNRTAITDVGKRTSTRAEKLFAVGTGTFVSPSLMGFEGTLSYQDVQDARNS